jgi:hypothetical protein
MPDPFNLIELFRKEQRQKEINQQTCRKQTRDPGESIHLSISHQFLTQTEQTQCQNEKQENYSDHDQIHNNLSIFCVKHNENQINLAAIKAPNRSRKGQLLV